jgi:hypothetical protein
MLVFLGTISDDPVGTVKRLMTGLEYHVQKDVREPEYGWCNVNIGRVRDLKRPTPIMTTLFQAVHVLPTCLNIPSRWKNILILPHIFQLSMPMEHLKANLMTLLTDVKSKVPPTKQKQVIWRLCVSCAPGIEKFELDLFDLLGIKQVDAPPPTVIEPVKRKTNDDDDDEADVKVANRQ